jgi:hypothetical protein
MAEPELQFAASNGVTKRIQPFEPDLSLQQFQRAIELTAVDEFVNHCECLSRTHD